MTTAQTPHEKIVRLKPRGFASLGRIEHGGSLEARRTASGSVVEFYWRINTGGRIERVRIGPYDSSTAAPKSLKPNPKTGGYSIAAAREKARELAKQNAETPGGLRAQREREQAERDAAARETAARQKHTLKALCADYCTWLQARGKSSSREAEIIFGNHVPPELADKPAAEVSKREVVEVVRKLTEAGKAPTARKLRAYLRAAYACAVRADSDPALPSSFISYGVTSNPVEGVAAIPGKTAKNPLTAAELRTYWKTLQGIDGVVGAALRLQLLTGAQRVAQLSRLTVADLTGDALRLLDPKGKRAEAREHLLPVTRAIRAELDQLAAEGYLLSTDGGKTPMHATSLSAWARDVGIGAGIKDFQLKRVRSAVETVLAEAGVSREVRGQLQSHGLGGVQDRHYDAHHYLGEKRKALEKLHRLLVAEPTARNVTVLRQGSGS